MISEDTTAETIDHTGLSVVIATLGGECLQNTIQSLMNGSKVPDEILICIPEAHAHKAAGLKSDRVKVMATAVKGQVKQRAYGFSLVSNYLVLQLDDDILLEKDSIEKMIEHLLRLGKGNVLAPVFYGQNSNLCIHSLKKGPAAISKNLFDYFICAAPWGEKKMGTVSRIGLNYGVDDSLCKEELIRTDWVPGGCVLSFKEELILKDFFPFTGKAYCEDIFHSYYRKEAGISSWVAPAVKVYIEEPEPEFSPEAVDKVIQIRRRLLQLIKGPQWRLSIYEIFCKMRSRFYTKRVKA